MNIKMELVKIICKQTEDGIRSTPGLQTTNSFKFSSISAKAESIKKKIENSVNFDNDAKEDLADILSDVIGEKIKMDFDRDDDGDGEALNTPLFSLIVCKKDCTDAADNDISRDEFILKVSPNLDDIDFTDSNYFKEEDWIGLSIHGTGSYTFNSADKPNIANFRFAINEEIERFVNRLPEKAIDFWFESVIVTLSMISQQ